MSERNCVDPVRDVIEGALNLGILEAALLQRDRGQDELEVVLDPVLHLPQQYFARFGLRARGDSLRFGRVGLVPL